MKPSKLLFGNIPKEHWELQLKLSNERILLAKKRLGIVLDTILEDRDFKLVNDIYEAIEFWENLKQEAQSSLAVG